MDTTKYCPKCDKTLPAKQFHKNKAQPSGLSSWCKQCRNKHHKIPEEREKRRIALAAWQDRNREHVNEQALRAYYALKERREADPRLDEHLRKISRAKSARHRANHPGIATQYNQTYLAKPGNKDKVNASRKTRRAKDPTKHRAYQAARDANKRGASRNDLTAAQWEAIKAHYGYRCIYCGKKPRKLTQDHITPLSKGGPHTLSNVIPACRSCNSKKLAGPVLKPVQPLLLL